MDSFGYRSGSEPFYALHPVPAAHLVIYIYFKYYFYDALQVYGVSLLDSFVALNFSCGAAYPIIQTYLQILPQEPQRLVGPSHLIKSSVFMASLVPVTWIDIVLLVESALQDEDLPDVRDGLNNCHQG
jgi:hypothetical protein